LLNALLETATSKVGIPQMKEMLCSTAVKSRRNIGSENIQVRPSQLARLVEKA
jgi:hypothetical protein